MPHVAIIIFGFLIVLAFATEPLWMALVILGAVFCFVLGALLALAMMLDMRRRPTSGVQL